MDVTSRISEALGRHGCTAHGFTTADPFAEMGPRLEDAVASGRSGGLPFTFREPRTSSDPKASFPWARSIVVAAMPYLPGAGMPGTARPGTARIARFATRDHYEPLRHALHEVAQVLFDSGFRAEVLVDDSRLVDRAAAVRAGVGWSGRSTLVLVPGAGPWVLLGSVITDADLEPSAEMRRGCGTCTACIPACPTGAIIAPGVLDARRCLSAILQSPGWIPAEIRTAVGDRLYGCDDCLDACPPGDRLLALATNPVGRVDVYALLGSDDAALRASVPHFYVPRNEGRWLRRNALVVLGNTGGPGSVGVLAGYSGHRDPMLRGHAAWSLGQVGDARAKAVLRRIAGSDPDEQVAAEATAALDGTLPG
ncbi:MAG: tRNA epoxyqueuosine(34) reductase QueG [Actinomycetota bacterium]